MKSTYKVTVYKKHGYRYRDFSVLAESPIHAKAIAVRAGYRVAPCSVYPIDEYAIEKGLIKALEDA